MKVKKHKPIVYRYYDLLKQNHLGKENNVKSQVLAEYFGVSRAIQKTILKEINESVDFDKLISTCGSIYMCNTKEEVALTLSHTYNTAITLIKKAQAMQKKAQKQGQYKIKLGEYYKDFITVFEE